LVGLSQGRKVHSPGLPSDKIRGVLAGRKQLKECAALLALAAVLAGVILLEVLSGLAPTRGQAEYSYVSMNYAVKIWLAQQAIYQRDCSLPWRRRELRQTRFARVEKILRMVVPFPT
jgi:hypothetical protein